MKDATCKDENCPHHGSLRARGQIFEGIVASDKMQKAVRVEWFFQRYLPKYERYVKKRTAILAHLPACISAKVGDKVRITECRPLSRTIKFVVMEKIIGEKNESS